MKNVLYSMMIAGLTVVSTAALMFASCDSPDKLDPGGGGGGGVAGTRVINMDAAIGKGGSGGGGGSTGVQPTGDANCGSVTSSTNRMPADVLLVLDRSGSMNESISESCYCDAALAGSNRVCADTANCTPRWTTLTSALDATLASTRDAITWGLKLYTSGGSGCTVNNGVEVAVGPTAVSQIQSRIGSTAPGGNTPTAQAIDAAVAYLKTVTDPNNKVILLATDGEPNCRPGGSSGSSNVPGTITAIGNAQAAGFLVYVIGIGTEIGNLDNFAQAGGTNKYYPATSPKELADAFANISQLVTTCTFALNLQAGADINNVAVYLDKNLVQKDPASGWSFGANNQSVVLNGASCEKVKTGAASNVQILVGCDIPPGKIP